MSDDLVKNRYAFAMSSFGRMFGPPRITEDMRRLCKQWSEDTRRATPMHNDLDGVDEYFLEMWKSYTAS